MPPAAAETESVSPQMLDAWIAQEERAARLATFARHDGFLAFCHYYFGPTARFEDETPAVHLEWVDLATNYEGPAWRTPAGKRRRGVVLAAPRGHAKTTIFSFALPLWWLCTRRKEFIVLLSAGATGAGENVLDIRHELETNESLRADYGDMCGLDLGYRWTTTDFVAVQRDPATGKVVWRTRLVAKSPGGKIRGLHAIGGVRPDAILADDMEDDESVESAAQIAKFKRWLHRSALPSMHPRRGVFVMIGTIIHYDSVLAQLLGPAYANIYVQRVYKAHWEEPAPGGAKGTRRRYLWPGRFTPEFLADEKIRLGTLGYNSEYLNEPIDPETRIVRPEWVSWYTWADMEHRGAEGWFYKGRHLTIYQAFDPAISEEEVKNVDSSAHVTLGVTEEDETLSRVVVVLWVEELHIDFPHQCALVLEQYDAWLPALIAIETTAYQLALAQELRRLALLPVSQVTHARATKMVRLTATSVLFEHGQILFRALGPAEIPPAVEGAQPATDWDELQQVRVHPNARALYDQVTHYPRVAHDDLFDALETALALGMQRRGMASYAMEQGAYQRQSDAAERDARRQAREALQAEVPTEWRTVI